MLRAGPEGPAPIMSAGNLPGVKTANRNYAFVVPFVETLASLGLEHACICPGSRNTPLSLALAAEPAVRDWSFHDERSAAFFALGMAKATRTPAAVVTTSGTAAAELLPAAVEARGGRVPLLLLTADRPPELRDVGAPQAVDQVKLYGDAAKWFHDVGVPEPSAAFIRSAPALAARAWAEALEAPSGPVHLNFPFREPLVPEEVPGDVPDPFPEVAAPRYQPAMRRLEEETVTRLARSLAGKKAVVMAGPTDDPALPAAAADLAAAQRIPIVADALSGLRAGAHPLEAVIAHGQALLEAGWLEDNRPDVVLRIGAVPTSTPLFNWFASGVPHVLIEPAGWRDPDAVAGWVVRADPAATLSAMAKATTVPAPGGWLETWREADDLASAALTAVMAAEEYPTEPGVVQAVAESVPSGAALWVASSMPVRDVDTFFGRIDRPVRILANRGANGIDGFLSAGFGSALADPSPTYLLAGDLSVLHDLGALHSASRLDIPATVIAVNNDGGGIFHFLPQVGFPDHFERHFTTPHGLDLVAVAEALGIAAQRARSRAELAAALSVPPVAPRLVEVRTDRARNVDVHRAATAAVAEALG